MARSQRGLGSSPGPPSSSALMLRGVVFSSKGHLTGYGLFILGGVIGIFSGLLIRAFKSVLFALAYLLWMALPIALERAGWTYDSDFSLRNYIWIMNALLGVIIAFLSVPLLDQIPAPTIGAWVRFLHRSRTGVVPLQMQTCCSRLTLGWVGGFVLLVLLTASSGASFGPEPLVVIVPSAIAGAFVAGPLGQPAPVARAAALAGGAGGLSAFFGLPIASAFAVLELPNVDGMQFALEAMPACMAASLFGTIFGDTIWARQGSIGHSILLFPGGYREIEVHGVDLQPMNSGFGIMALLWGAPAGLATGLVVHIVIIAVKKLHHVSFVVRHGRGGARHRANGDEHPRPGPWALRLRRALLLAVAGAANGALALRFPGLLFWGEEELQIALTRGCTEWPDSRTECERSELRFMYPGLYSSPSAEKSGSFQPYSAGEMFLMASGKFLQIFICELSGFVGGAIYPTVFASAAFGSALGAVPGVMALGREYVMVSTCAAISVGLCALLNTPIFAMMFVLVIQTNIPHGSASAQMMTLLFAVCCHYLLARPFIHMYPGLTLVATQQPRWDMKYVNYPWDKPPRHEEECDRPTAAATEDVEIGSVGTGANQSAESEDSSRSSASGSSDVSDTDEGGSGSEARCGREHSGFAPDEAADTLN